MTNWIDGINVDKMERFVGALESDKYKQGTMRLHAKADDAMCCLGVATAEIGPSCGVEISDTYHNVSWHYKDGKGQDYYLLMPPAVTEALGIPADFIDSGIAGDVILVEYEDPDEEPDHHYFRDGKHYIAVSTLNDAGTSFKEIARRIRETLSVKEN